MIKFDTVTKLYDGGAAAVESLSLEIPNRQITVFVGPSGCGKTTSLRMINRMTEPNSGRILIDGRNIADEKTTELRRNIGYVIQQGGLFPNKTVIDNVMTVPLLHHETRSTARARARQLLETVGLGQEHENRYPSQLSGGQQQRVGVARALAADPPILLMDEPFSAVDPVVRAQLQDELLGIQAQLSKTIVFVTHDIDEAIKLGDRIAVMSPGGRLAQYDTPETILAEPSNAFVASFVGRDRGYRALGFTNAALQCKKEKTITLGETIESARKQATDGWVLVLDEVQEPRGWYHLTGEEDSSAFISEDALHLGGTLATENGSLRAALDAALSSPSGRGVIVHPDGGYVGTIRAGQVFDQLNSAHTDFVFDTGAHGQPT